MPPERSQEQGQITPALACRQCRALKVRCVRDDGTRTPCQRCARLELPCAPQAATRRGRPSRAGSAGSTRRDIQAPPTSVLDRPPRPSYSPSYPAISPRGETNPSRHFLADSLMSLASGPGPNSAESDPLSRVDDSESVTRHTPRDPNNIRMADHIDRDDIVDILDVRDGLVFPPVTQRTLPPRDVSGRTFEHEDPISLGLISLPEAQHLVKCFHQHLNPLIALLDPNLHTLEYLRKTSSVLLSSVLAASSKFFKKDVHTGMLSHANTIVSRAVIAGDETKALVQSLLILVYWKSPEDTSAWRRIGWSIRMGYQFHWYQPRKRPLPEDRQLALETLDSERTWILLYVFDRSYSRPFGLPATIRPHEIGDVEAWAYDHPQYLNPADLHLTCVIELQRLRETWEFIVQQHSQGTSMTPYQNMMVADMESRCIVQFNKWFGPQGGPPNFVIENELRPKWSLLDLMLAIKRFGLSSSDNELRDLDQYLHLVGQITEILESLAEWGILPFFQDLSSASTSAMALFVKKLFRRFSVEQQGIAVALLERVLRCHEKVSVDDPSAATAFVARFIRRVLAAIGEEVNTMLQQPAPTESVPLAQTAAIDTLAATLGQFTNPATLNFDFNTSEDEYWAQLLAATVSTGNWNPAPTQDPRMFLSS